MLKKVYIELTTRCNMNCKFCYRNTWENDLQCIHKETLEKIKANIDPNVGIVFGGIGEPTIARHFSFAVELFKEHTLEMTTNGVIKEELLEMICANFEKLIVSVDGVDEDYKEMRGGSFEPVRKTLAYIRNYKLKHKTRVPHVEFAFILTKSNKDSIYKVVDTAYEYDVDQVLVSHLLPTYEYQLDDIYYSKWRDQEKHDYLLKVNNYSYFNHRTKVIMPYMEIKTERFCPFVEKGHTYVDHQGDVVPCYRLANTYTEYVFGRKKEVKKYSFGNLESKSLHEIYDGKEYLMFRKNVINTKHPSCVDCDYVDGCSFVETTEFDCYSYTPSCADCLWNRNIIRCT